MHKLTSCILAGLLALCIALPVQAAEAGFAAEVDAYIAKIVRFVPVGKSISLHEQPDSNSPKEDTHMKKGADAQRFFGNGESITGADGKQWYAVECEVYVEGEPVFVMLEQKKFVQADKVKKQALDDFEKGRFQNEKFSVYENENWEEEFPQFVLRNDVTLQKNSSSKETATAGTTLVVYGYFLEQRDDKWWVPIHIPVDKKRLKNVGYVELETLEKSTFASGEQAVRERLAFTKKRANIN